MRKRWWGNGRGGGEGDVLRSVALMTTTSWSLAFLAIPTAHRRRTHSDTLLSIWAADCQARLSRECSGLLESHLLGSEFYWVVTLLHGKKDIRKDTILQSIFRSISNVRAVNRRSPQLSIQPLSHKLI